ncbi:hypothetical protein [Tessaracoccus sp.]
MCNSQAEGGQRCYSHTKTAMAAAETKYNTLVEEADTYTHAGQPVPADLRTKGMQAAYDREDALARYASTPKGAADLNARMAALLIDGKVPGPYGPTAGACEEYHDYAEALSDGARLRDRAKAARDGVRNGTMTAALAADLTRHPSYETVGRRLTKLSAHRPGAPVTPPTMETSRTALKAATDATIASTAKEVKAAVTLIAATVHAKYPNAQTVELEGSDQGDYLNVISIDGDEEKLYDLESGDDSYSDDLSWAASCIYDAHRTTAPALHSANNRPIQRTDNLYINITEAINSQ